MKALDPDSQAGRRREARASTRIYAQLDISGQSYVVCITTLSSEGAGLLLDTLPPLDSEALLSWDCYEFSGSVIWADGHRCGLKFAEEISAELLAHLTQGNRVEGRYARDLARNSILRQLDIPLHEPKFPHSA